MHLNLFENHFNYIKHFSKYAKKYICETWRRVFNNPGILNDMPRHALQQQQQQQQQQSETAAMRNESKKLKKMKKIWSNLQLYCDQLIVLGFNSQKYDIPLIKNYLPWVWQG